MPKRRGPTPRREWEPMEPAVPTVPTAKVNPGGRWFMNDRYTVIAHDTVEGGMWLSIRRNDRRAVRDWRDFQRIKNEIAGDEREAFEIYPAESRLVDTANQYHLWVLPEGDRLPVGWQDRIVTDEAGRIMVNGVPLTDDQVIEQAVLMGAPPGALAKTRQRPRS